MLGYEHGFSHQVVDLVTAIAEGTDPHPSFAEGLSVQRVLDAVERSSESESAWVRVAAAVAGIRLNDSPGESTSKERATMARPITLFTGQWADLPFEEVARLAGEWGYDGLEIACWGDHLDVSRWDDDAYVQSRLDILERNGLKVYAISNHLTGQAVCDDPIDERHRDILSDRVWGDGDPEGVRQRAAEDLKDTARIAAKLGVKTVNGFSGSSIWKAVAMFPPASEEFIARGYQDFADRFHPILDVFEEVGVRFALEVHPSEIAYDYWTAKDTLDAIGHRKSFGFNFDPSHFVWQQLDYVAFVLDFADHIFHVHVKESITNLDGRNGVLGSHRPWADPRRGWTFVSTGHGDVRWEPLFRALNAIGYEGPTSVEWEDAGMDRLIGAPEALAFVRELNGDHAACRRVRRRILDQVAVLQRPIGIGILGAAGIAERAIVEPARELDGVRVIAIGARDPNARAHAGRSSRDSRIRRLRDGPESPRRRPRLHPAALDGAGALGGAGAAGGQARALREAAVGERDELRRRSPTLRMPPIAAPSSDSTTGCTASPVGCWRCSSRGCSGRSSGVEFDYSIPHFVVQPGNIRLDGDLGGGSFMDVGCYAVDLVRAAWGEPTVVSAEAVTYADDPRVDMQTDAELELADGIPVHVRSSFIGDDEGSMSLRVTGSAADLRRRASSCRSGAR